MAKDYEPICIIDVGSDITLAVDAAGQAVIAAPDRAGQGTVTNIGNTVSCIDALMRALAHLKSHMPDVEANTTLH